MKLEIMGFSPDALHLEALRIKLGTAQDFYSELPSKFGTIEAQCIKNRRAAYNILWQQYKEHQAQLKETYPDVFSHFDLSLNEEVALLAPDKLVRLVDIEAHIERITPQADRLNAFERDTLIPKNAFLMQMKQELGLEEHAIVSINILLKVPNYTDEGAVAHIRARLKLIKRLMTKAASADIPAEEEPRVTQAELAAYIHNANFISTALDNQWQYDWVFEKDDEVEHRKTLINMAFMGFENREQYIKILLAHSSPQLPKNRNTGNKTEILFDIIGNCHAVAPEVLLTRLNIVMGGGAAYETLDDALNALVALPKVQLEGINERLERVGELLEHVHSSTSDAEIFNWGLEHPQAIEALMPILEKEYRGNFEGGAHNIKVKKAIFEHARESDTYRNVIELIQEMPKHYRESIQENLPLLHALTAKLPKDLDTTSYGNWQKGFQEKAQSSALVKILHVYSHQVEGFDTPSTAKALADKLSPRNHHWQSALFGQEKLSLQAIAGADLLFALDLALQDLTDIPQEEQNKMAGFRQKAMTLLLGNESKSDKVTKLQALTKDTFNASTASVIWKNICLFFLKIVSATARAAAWHKTEAQTTDKLLHSKEVFGDEARNPQEGDDRALHREDSFAALLMPATRGRLEPRTASQFESLLATHGREARASTLETTNPFKAQAEAEVTPNPLAARHRSSSVSSIGLFGAQGRTPTDTRRNPRASSYAAPQTDDDTAPLLNPWT